MKLIHLTDYVLLNEASFWANKEREALINILWRLKEIDERKLYSDLKCTSLYDYCVKVLKYSEGQASRRVTATRLLKEVPEISEEIKSGNLTLTQINQAKSFFEEENIKKSDEKLKVFEEIKGKTTRESEKILGRLKKEPEARRINVKLLEGTVEVLNKLKGLKAHSCRDFDSLILKMAEEVERIWDPKVVLRKRAERAGESRYVQVGVRAKIWKRDSGKCTQCGSTYALEIDHVFPFAAGGKTSEDNLRLLCRSCNQRKRILFFGKGKTSSFK